MKKYQVIALDLDGTLLTSDKTVSPRTLSALLRCMENGMQPVIATGRARTSIPDLLPAEFPVIPWISSHGAETYLDSKKLSDSLISVSLAHEIVQITESLAPDMRVSTVMDGVWYATQPIGIPHVIADLREVIDRPVPKIVCDLSQLGDVDAFQTILPDGCRLIIAAHLGEIVASGVSKVSTLRTLLEEWGMTLHDVVAFGDHLPDLEMIAACGLGVAMGNAVPEVKEAADLVTSSCDEDGIAEVLERLVEGK
ncbi:MAG TPA: Cof-type HAD-IIB family hydrolase [Armatimonadota bacterium]|nr:Cof-type HAD-IIB family hydrolase [Armatimonadota bacterium]